MTYLLRLVACLFLCVSLNAFAALYDRGNGLIYDDVLDITWLQDINYSKTSGHDVDGLMIWQDAKQWVDNLNYAGYNEWRLPSANLINGSDPCYSFDGSCDLGYNNIISEFGYMYYSNLGNSAAYSSNGTYGQNFESFNIRFSSGESGELVSFFSGLPSETDPYQWGIPFWLNEELESDTGRVWLFFTSIGRQLTYPKYPNSDGLFSSWAVHDGDIGASPVPLPAAAWLFGSALVGLGLVKRSK